MRGEKKKKTGEVVDIRSLQRRRYLQDRLRESTSGSVEEPREGSFACMGGRKIKGPETVTEKRADYARVGVAIWNTKRTPGKN